MMLSRFTQIASSSGSSYNYKSVYNKDKLKTVGKTSCEEDYLSLKKKLKEAEKRVSASCAGLNLHSRRDSNKADVSNNQEQPAGKAQSEHSLDNESVPSRSLVMRESTYTKGMLTEIKEVNLDEENIRESPRHERGPGLLTDRREERKRLKEMGMSADGGKTSAAKSKLGRLLDERAKETVQTGYMSISREGSVRNRRPAVREPDSSSPKPTSKKSEEIKEVRMKTPKILFVNTKKDPHQRRKSMEEKVVQSEHDPFGKKLSLAIEERKEKVAVDTWTAEVQADAKPELDEPKRNSPVKPKIIKFASAGIKEKRWLLQESITQALEADPEPRPPTIPAEEEQFPRPRVSIRIRLKEREKSDSLTINSRASSSNKKESLAHKNKEPPAIPLKKSPNSRQSPKSKRKNHSTHLINNNITKEGRLNKRSLSRASANIPSQDRLSRASIERSISAHGQMESQEPIPPKKKQEIKAYSPKNRQQEEQKIRRNLEVSPQSSSKSQTSSLSKPNNRHLISSLLSANGRSPDEEEREMKLIKEQIKSRKLALENELESNRFQLHQNHSEINIERQKETTAGITKQTQIKSQRSDRMQLNNDNGFRSNGNPKQPSKPTASSKNFKVEKKVPDKTTKMVHSARDGTKKQDPLHTKSGKTGPPPKKQSTAKPTTILKKELSRDRNSTKREGLPKITVEADNPKPQTQRKLSPKVKKAAQEYLEMVGKLNEKESASGTPASPKEILKKTEEILKDIDESEPKQLDISPKLLPVPEDVVKEQEEESVLLGEKKKEEKRKDPPIDPISEKQPPSIKSGLVNSDILASKKHSISSLRDRSGMTGTRKSVHERLYEFGNIGAPPSFRQLKEKMG